MPFRLLSYLAPSVPERLSAVLADHLAASLGADVALTFDDSRSGPRPSQPAVVRSDLDGALRAAVCRSLLRADSSPAVADALAAARLTGSAPVTDDHYGALRAGLADLDPPAVEPA